MALTSKEILARLRSRRRHVEPVTLALDDGEELQVGLVVLNPQEHQEAVLAAAKHFDARGVEPGRALLVDAWNGEVGAQVLARAIVELEGGENRPGRVFDSAESLRRGLRSLDEMSHLLDAYYAHPDYELRAAMTEERLQDLADEVRRNPLVLRSCDTASLRKLVLSLVARPSS